MSVKFTFGLRVRVTDPDTELGGFTGTVVRILRSSEEAWVELDSDPPKWRASFPPSDPRHRHVRLFDDEVEVI